MIVTTDAGGYPWHYLFTALNQQAAVIDPLWEKWGRFS
jgi:hypothetical protein